MKEVSSFINVCQCLNLRNKNDQYSVIYAGIVNRECERFKLNEISPDIFKYLLVVHGLNSSKGTEIRLRILIKLEQYPKLTFPTLVKECQLFINLKHGSVKIQERDYVQAQKVRPNEKKEEKFRTTSQENFILRRIAR